MFKCEVIGVRYYLNIKETQVIYRVSDKGNNKTYNHQLTGKVGNRSFIIGEVDKSIKTGDLIRCDGLPFMAKPAYSARTKIVKDSNNCKQKVTIKYNLPSGYSPFKLDSGYWVLRKNNVH